MGNAIPLNNTNHGCSWRVSFEEIIFPGDYRLEVFMMWLNELAEPDELTRLRTKTDRINDGMVVNLGGIGGHPYFILNASLHYYNFDGYIAKQSDRRDIFIIINGKLLIFSFSCFDLYVFLLGTKHPFNSWNQFVSLGFTTSHIVNFPPVLLNYFPIAKDYLPEYTDPAQIQALKDTFPKPIEYHDINGLLNKLGSSEIADVDGVPRAEALMYNIPKHGLKVKLPSSSTAVISRSYPLCSNPKEVTVGYWRQDPVCEPIQSLYLQRTNQMIGHECLHHVQPVYSQISVDFQIRKGHSFIWKPANCNMIQHRINIIIDPKLSFCDNLRKFVRNPVKDIEDPTAALLKETEPLHFTEPLPAIPSPLFYTKSVAQFALRKAGVGLLAGFGDSVGDELRDNTVQLLGGGEWNNGNGITCQNGRNKIHRLIPDEFPNSSPLVDCISMVADSMPLTIPLFQEYEKVVFDDYFIKNPDNLSEEEKEKLKSNFLIQSNETIPVKSVVLVTNFMCQHSVWIHTLTEIENALHLHAKFHADLAEKLLKEKNIIYRRIFYTGIAIHGFKTGGLTPARSKKFNQLAKEILGGSGWEVLDAFALTIGRPEGTVDGVHYRGGVSIAIADAFMNMLTNNGTCH